MENIDKLKFAEYGTFKTVWKFQQHESTIYVSIQISNDI